jgi:hypothetical protein
LGLSQFESGLLKSMFNVFCSNSQNNRQAKNPSFERERTIKKIEVQQ